ncbi:MAG: hypothetical protein Q8L29_04330 [archaeon]|nr:hypothetical protein [archaeon]
MEELSFREVEGRLKELIGLGNFRSLEKWAFEISYLEMNKYKDKPCSFTFHELAMQNRDTLLRLVYGEVESGTFPVEIFDVKLIDPKPHTDAIIKLIDEYQS